MLTHLKNGVSVFLMGITMPEHWYQDTSHPAVHIFAAQGVAQSLDAALDELRLKKVDVSPKMDKGSWYHVVANLYEPPIVTMHFTQDLAPKEGGLHTEIVSTGVGDRVASLALEVAELMHFSAQPLTSRFTGQIALEQNMFKGMHDDFARLVSDQAPRYLAEALKVQQQKYHSGAWKKDRN